MARSEKGGAEVVGEREGEGSETGQSGEGGAESGGGGGDDGWAVFGCRGWRGRFFPGCCRRTSVGWTAAILGRFGSVPNHHHVVATSTGGYNALLLLLFIPLWIIPHDDDDDDDDDGFDRDSSRLSDLDFTNEPSECVRGATRLFTIGLGTPRHPEREGVLCRPQCGSDEFPFIMSLFD